MTSLNEKLALVTDGVHPLLIKGLSNLYQVDYQPHIGYDEVGKIIHKYDGLVINSKIKVDQAFLLKAKKLKWVGRLGSGLDVIDLNAAKKFNVTVMNSPEGNANAVGEHALGMLLALFNKLPAGDEMVRSMSTWNRESMRGRELDGLTVGIIGCGHTGSAFVKKLRGFEVEVLIYDKYKTTLPKLHANQEICDLDTVLRRADILSLHLPLTSETNSWVDEHFIDKMKQNAVLINTSRGKIVNLKALILNLENGKLSGACLDVFENEKPNHYSSMDMENMQKISKLDQVLLTPHVAGWTIESKMKIAETLLNKIINTVKAD